ncbi:MAG: TetR/AcrR family transcriptional regulator [Pseudomonadota bacterium]
MIETKEPSQHHHGNLKQALIDYALKAARDGALEELSLRKASRDLGVSTGAAYRHFNDRDSLLQTVAQRGFDMLADQFEATLPFNSRAKDRAEARNRFTGLATAYLRFSQDHTNLWRLMFGPYGLVPQSESNRPSTYDWLGKSLQELAQFGLIRTPDRSAQFFAWTSIHGLSDLASSPAAASQLAEDLVSTHCAFMLNALAPNDTIGL